jgi:GT2 family glycosyltransferase
MNDISLIIITYDRPADMLELLQSLAKQDALDTLQEVLVLNNASKTSYAVVEEYIAGYPELKVKYEFSNENLGVSRGRNKLMAQATGSQLLVLDDDILFTKPGDLHKISTAFDKPFFKENNTAVITFKVVYHETGEQQVTAFPHKKFEEMRNTAQFLTSYFTGCSHLMKRELLEKTGLYPVDFFYGMEEYDLSYRIIRAGYTLGYDDSVTFEHKESPKGRQPNYQKLSSQWINKSTVAWKYLPAMYYLTTSFGWSVEYMKKSGGHWGTFFKSWGRALSIPFRVKRDGVGRSAMEYLKKVKARLWY